MSSNTGLPEIVLSKKCAKFLMTRNAGEGEIFRKKSFLLEKAKTKEEKVLQRERELLIQRQLKTLKAQERRTTYCTFGQLDAANKTLQIEGEKLWEASSDTTLCTRQRRKQRLPLNRCKPSACFSTCNSSGQHLTVPPADSPTSVRSLSCVLPPIQSKSYSAYSTASVTQKSKEDVCVDKHITDTVRKWKFSG